MPAKTTATKAASSAALTESAPLDAATFDIHAWMAGARPVTKTVTIHQRGDLFDQVSLLNVAYERAIALGEDRTMDDPSPDWIEQQQRDLVDEIEASALKITLRALSSRAISDIREEVLGENATNPTPAENEDVTYATLAASIESPAGLTAGTLRQMNEVVGDAQFVQLIHAFQAITNAAPKVDASFSRRSSRRQAAEQRA